MSQIVAATFNKNFKGNYKLVSQADLGSKGQIFAMNDFSPERGQVTKRTAINDWTEEKKAQDQISFNVKMIKLKKLYQESHVKRELK